MSAPELLARALVQRARDLKPMVAAQAAATESQRLVLEPTLRALRDAELLCISQPSEFGGHQLAPTVLHDVAIELASACGSTGWLSIIFNTGAMVAQFPNEAQHDVWEPNPKAMVSAALTPSGRAIPEGDGYLVSGSWSYCSGVDYTDWLIVGAMVPKEKAPPEIRSFLLPRAAYRVEDDWFVSGLRGSGSKSVHVESVFVPAHRSTPFADLREGKSPSARVPLYRLPFVAIFPSSILAPGIGMAMGALQAWKEWNEKRTLRGGRPAKEQQSTQQQLGESSAAIHFARTTIRHNVTTMLEAVQRGEEPTLEDRASMQRDVAFAGRLCLSAVQGLYDASGASVLADSHPVQRPFRDLQAVCAHVTQHHKEMYEHYGKTAFGLGPGNPFLF